MLLGLAQLRVGPLRQPADRAAHASGPLVGGVAQDAAVALAPLFEQRRGQQRQPARRVEHVGHQGVGERGLDAQPGALGRTLDRPPQLVAAHRADEHLVGPDQPGEPLVRGALPVEVGAHGEHDLAVVLHQRVQERRPLGGVVADREDLLELVDHEQVGGLDARVGAGADDPHRPALRARQRATRERRQQPRPHGRRLAAPGRPDDGEQRRADEPRDEFGHEPLTAEEVLRVRGVERAEAHVGTHGRRRDVVLGFVERPARQQVAGEIVLGGAQFGPPVRGAPGAGRGGPLRRLAAGGARVAVAFLDDHGDPRVRDAVGAGDLGDVLVAERIERRVMGQDRLLERAQVGPRLDADLLDQRVARAAVGLERVGLAPAAVERQHQRTVQALAQGLLGHRGLELRDQVGMAPEREFRLGPRLERRPAALLEAQDLGLRERLELEVGQWRAAPEVEREAENLGRLLGFGFAAAGHQVLEAVEIALLRAEVQPVGMAARLEPPVAPERLP